MNDKLTVRLIMGAYALAAAAIPGAVYICAAIHGGM